MTDPITDMMNRIKNAQAVKKPHTDIPYSNLKDKIAQVLVAEGFINSAEKKYSKTRKIIKIELKYQNNKGAITNIKRISKPGKRVYTPVKEIKLSAKGGGMIVISTPKGIMRAKEAKNMRVGGELIIEIW
jgi:small subunit ribosomal protein S8